MGKLYLDKNVFDASVERLNFIFDEFDLIYLSVSGGKDSSVMMQITNKIAEERNRKYDVFYMDLEGQYQATMNHISELKKLSQVRTFYHMCLPVNLSNACSVFQPHWTCWDETVKDKWVRAMPEDAINIHNHPFGDYFVYGEEFETWMVKFPLWLKEKFHKDKVAGLVGIRADESLNRFRSIAFGKSLYKGKKWSTDNGNGYYSFYPIYDWATEDIWGAVSKYNLKFNEVYEMLYKNGLSIHQQRICQPYGMDQRVSLNQWAVLEPETWHKIVNRVSGANFGNIYCKTSLLGHNNTEKPDHLSWQEYAVFLLESLGLYSPELMKHYIRKIQIYFEYYKTKFNVDIHEIPDDISKKDLNYYKEKYNENGWISWKRIARCIEKNDYACHYLSYGLTITDKEEILVLKKKWGKLLGLQTNRKDLRELHKEIEET